MGGFSYPAPRRLEDIVKLDLFASEPKKKVEEIWNEYHDGKEFNISEAWPVGDFEALMASAKSNGRLFIWPVKREGGHMVILSQVQESHILFTYLEDYKRDPAGAQPYLVVTMYSDLAASKDTVLVRGDITPLALDEAESTRLVANVKEFYLNRPDDVASFNKGTFDFEKHIQSLLES